MKKLITPAFWIVAFQAIAYGIGLVTRAGMGWYEGLEKSSLNPPDLAFPIVWSALYVMLALAGWMMWMRRDAAPQAFRLYWAQMALNWGWSFVFFGAHMALGGFLWILALDLAMLAFIIAAWRGGYRLPAMLVVPTFLWGSFAGYLNYSIWVLN